MKLINIKFVLLLLSSNLYSGMLQAELSMPDGKSLLSACEYATDNGYDNPKGMLCIWYVTPCDCSANKVKDLPRVCLPPEIHHEALATLVIKALQQDSELQRLGAEEAAIRILSKHYPCG